LAFALEFACIDMEQPVKTLLVTAMNIVLLSLTACGGDDDDTYNQQPPSEPCPEGGDNAGAPISVVFQDPVVHEIDMAPQHVVTGDFDDDGAVDVAYTGGAQDQRLILRYGVGDGTLGDEVALVDEPANLSVWGVAAGDMDGDGVVDLVNSYDLPGVDMEGPQVEIRFGGAAFPAEVVEIYTSSLHLSSRNLAVGDVDGDGLADVVGQSPVSCWVSYNLGDRAFTSGAGIGGSDGIDEQALLLNRVFVTNLDGDPQAEVIASTSAGGNGNGWRIYDIDADHGVTARTLSGAFGPWAYAAEVLDINDDGRAELIFALQQAIGVVWNDGGTPGSGPRGEYCVNRDPYDFGGVGGIGAGDFDGDGLTDVVVGYDWDYELVFLGGTAGGDALREPMTIASGSDEPRDIAVADLDDNGAPDVVAVFQPPGSDNDLVVYLAD